MNEVNHAVRAYSPEGGRWDLDNGRMKRAGKEARARDLARAPFNFFQLVKAVASGDPGHEVTHGAGDIPTTRRTSRCSSKRPGIP